MSHLSVVIDSPDVAEPPVDARTQRLLQAPILPLLVKLAWPNILIMLAQASTGLIETWWLSRLGMDALAGMALVFPPVMLMTMISAGALGGGISSAVARSLGGGKRDVANSLVLHAIVINVVIGVFFSVLFVSFGVPIYRALGGQGGELAAALEYSNVVFATSVFIWVMNGLASLIRGTGNMWFPAAIICVGAFLLVPLSPILIFGFGPIPALGIAGGGLAYSLYNIGGTIAMLWYILSGRSTVKFTWVPMKWELFATIFRVGAISAIMAVLTNVIIGGVTAIVAAREGAAGVAGFGTGARLEYLLIPLIFGIGAPLVALVGANIGAGQNDRALKIGLTGGALAFVLTEIIGVVAAIFPVEWIQLFSADPETIAVGSAYLRTVGPAYGFFGLGLALYFASQGAGKLRWPLIAAFVRVTIALGAGYLAVQFTGNITTIFFALAASQIAYGVVTLVAIRSGAWFR
ncbi:MATE family efflux transporter [Rhizobium sp. S152]|uniref:MATE family efflux transporter n=1 Tax=Rhizobium sp. S152 TaxID=3055038 RepID=UPI0025AA045C|nr:MATE family efflux transporter [Rhizobium sp. S152]MDM9628540.1 MATE family efflux transporter [Rhizobium sp. S152]